MKKILIALALATGFTSAVYSSELPAGMREITVHNLTNTQVRLSAGVAISQKIEAGATITVMLNEELAIGFYHQSQNTNIPVVGADGGDNIPRVKQISDATNFTLNVTADNVRLAQ